MRPIWQYLNARLSRCNARINGFMKWNWENRDDDDEEMPSTITMKTSKVDDKAGGGGGKGLLPVCPKPRPDPGAAGTPPPPPCRPEPPTFKKKPIREIRKPKASSHSFHFASYPENILAIIRYSSRSTSTEVLGECLFFYKEAADTDFELNIGVDIWWKIWSTVLGYCNAAYDVRKSETFPRLYNTVFEDFFEHTLVDWKWPKENDGLRCMLEEYNSEVATRWLDVCLESAYLVSNSSTYRPPRPFTIGDDDAEDNEEANYFLQLPDFNREGRFHEGLENINCVPQ
jgi:hypothetical protein